MKAWFEHILYHTRVQPQRPAIVLLDRGITYGMLAQGIEAAARRLAALKLDGSAPVAITVESPLRQMVLALALHRIGIASLSAERMSALTGEIAFAAVLGDAEAGKFTPLGSRFIPVTDDWFAPGQTDHARLPAGFADIQQACRVSLTSGTTGASKLFRDTVADIGARAYHNYFGGIDLSRTGVLCMPGLSTTYGFGNACATLASGRPLYFASSSGEALAMIELYSIDFAISSTEQALSLAVSARRTGAQLKSLRHVIMGGSVPSRTLLEATMGYLCKDIICQYGATEIGLIARSMAREVLTRPGLVGFAVPGVELCAFDAAGSACGPGRPGAIKVRRTPMYQPAPDGRVRADWIPLGDHGWVDADRRIYVMGRSPVENATSQVPPEAELEHILRLEFDYDEAAAAVLDGEGAVSRPTIGVGIVGKHTVKAEQLAAAARSRGIDVSIALFEVKSIPRAANGKVKRDELAKLIRASTKIGAA